MPAYTMLRFHGWAACFLVLAACASACTGTAPVRLSAGPSDTVVINSRLPVTLPVRVVDAAGRARRANGLRFAMDSGAPIALSAAGYVTCGGERADAVVRVTRGALALRLVVLCRPIQGFRTVRGVQLLTGGPPSDLGLEAVGVDGDLVAEMAGDAAVRDTLVAVFRAGRVHPRARGATLVDVTVGDCATAVPVEVLERQPSPRALLPHQEFTTALRLVGGELHSWPVLPGRYELQLVPAVAAAPAVQRAAERLQLSAVEMNCARFPGTELHYSCVARERAAVIVRHPGAAGRGHELAGQLFVRRRPDNIGGASAAGSPRRAGPAECPFIAR